MSHLLLHFLAKLLMGVAIAVNHYLYRWSISVGLFMILLGLGALVPMFLFLYRVVTPKMPEDTMNFGIITLSEMGVFILGFSSFFPILLGVYILGLAFGIRKQLRNMAYMEED